MASMNSYMSQLLQKIEIPGYLTQAFNLVSVLSEISNPWLTDYLREFCKNGTEFR